MHRVSTMIVAIRMRVVETRRLITADGASLRFPVGELRRNCV